MHLDSASFELLLGAVPQCIAAERREERHRLGEHGQLHGGYRTAAASLLPRLRRVGDLAGKGHALHADELHPLDMPYDRTSHSRHAHKSAPFRVQGR
jgi:hypothetical protein